MTYGTEPLLAEVSYVAYHFHWPLDEILDLEHPLRQAFAAEIGRIHEARAESLGAGSGAATADAGW